MRTEMKIRIHAKGEVFQYGMPLDTTLEMMQQFNKVYSYCIGRSKKYYDKDGNYYFEPQINIEYIRKGSLSSLLTVDLPAAYAMISPLVAGYSWTLFKTTLSFTQAFVGTIIRRRSIPTVNVQDSPHSSNLILSISGDNNTILVGKDIFDTFHSTKKEIASLATFVGGHGTGFFDIKQIGSANKVIDKFRIDENNSRDLIVEEKEVSDDEEREYPCRIYSLNTKTKRGKLDIIKSDQQEDYSGAISFEIQDGDINRYVDAMKGEDVRLRAKSKMLVNTIGESKITYLYPSAIL